MKNIMLRGGQNDDLGIIIRNEWAEDGTTLLFEAALANIRDELADDFGEGRIRPFVEGEPIGTIQSRRSPMLYTETPAKQFERKQRDLVALRMKNDHDIERILQRR